MKRPTLEVHSPNAASALTGAECGAELTTKPAIESPVGSTSQWGKRWGVILAGGDGVRLRPLTRLICGDERPKQFCALLGRQTLLERTLRRSERSIVRDRIIVSLAGQHSKWHEQETALHPSQCIVQPANKGTAPAIVHSLLSLARLDPRALVAILPSDHYYSDESAFTCALDYAFEVAAEINDSVVLLGAKADYPEVEYGWIEIGSSLVAHRAGDLFRVRAFREKPPLDVAQRLLSEGSLWNTFVMVGRVDAFLQMVQMTLPRLRETIASAPMWTGRELHIEYSVYDHIAPTCFSSKVLSAHPEKLAVTRLNDLLWSDLGDPERAVVAARACGAEVPWIRKWKPPTGATRPAAYSATAVA